jgi:hypothetical protein
MGIKLDSCIAPPKEEFDSVSAPTACLHRSDFPLQALLMVGSPGPRLCEQGNYSANFANLMLKHHLTGPRARSKVSLRNFAGGAAYSLCSLEAIISLLPG